ncbi:hypothetical protein [Corynebacterium sp. HMSC034B08]|uniref:hypothetical protein n=1 Tax=Corynebacterium sp. HMSC034B08 TaxID=1715135 RepID=UPI00114CEC0D|nr:hypothetical protein [Corynebacterium sp. HMSC034B08]
MESNKISQEEARATLEQIDMLERDAQHKPTPLWAYVILGTLFGVTAAGLILRWTYWWALFTVIIIACIAITVRDHNRNVRPSMKQPIQEDPETNWGSVLMPLIFMPIIWLVPEGSVAGATIAGVLSAAVIIVTGYYWEKNR